MSRFSPFLIFDGNCADAMTFYQACLGGELTMTRLSDTPMKDSQPGSKQESILNSRLQSDVFDITACDWLHPTRNPRQGNMVCLYICEAPYTELKYYFDKLSDGADPELLDELTDMPFGSYGHLADKYGVHWFFQGQTPTDPQVGKL